MMAWRRAAGATAVVIAALAPVVIRTTDGRLRSAEALCLLAAAIGLAPAVGDAGLPSLAQGAFVGTGAYVTAVLQDRSGMGPLVAGTIAVIAALAVGGVLAAAVGR